MSVTVKTTICVGSIEIEVFNTDGKYTLSKSGIFACVGMVESNTPRWLKARSLEPLPSKRLKYTTETVGGTFDSVEFEAAINVWHYIGIHEKNELALGLVLALAIESLERRADKAFGILRSEQEYNQKLIARLATKQTFWWFTDEIKYWLDHRDEPSSNPQVHYIMAFKAMSVGLFGKTPKTIKEELGVKKSDLNRDHFGKESLGRIEAIQRLAKANLTIVGARPKESVEQAVYAFRYPIMDYKL